MTTQANKLRALLDKSGLLLMPGCHDAMSAKLIEQAGFDVGFMSGFAVSAARLAYPDTGLISYGEMVETGRNICSTVSIPMFGDGDTGFGNALNIKRTVKGYANAGFACIMLEDQVMPKRCGHTKDKMVVSREEAFSRVKAAIDARNEEGSDILIMARTDSRATHDLDEAIFRANEFAKLGADITFLEAPESIDEMKQYCNQVPGHKMANMIEHGKTPVLPAEQLEEIGYKVAVFPLSLINASIVAMRESLAMIKQGKEPTNVLDFEGLKSAVGFPEYYDEFDRYQ
ncbi:MAG: carboxyvinyl-carboxyphosphonate phosphorylmutase [Sulfurovum sp.]|nr:MAG: carboxyvinyl-carboxyphosphonate phosphorylmutase [Sulfurovum sp.]